VGGLPRPPGCGPQPAHTIVTCSAPDFIGVSIESGLDPRGPISTPHEATTTLSASTLPLRLGRRHAEAICVQPSNIVLCEGISLVRSLAVPAHRLAVVPLHAPTVIVQHPKTGIRGWMAPENQVRNGLSAGGKEIRTLGPAVEERPFRRAPYGFFRGNLIWVFSRKPTERDRHSNALLISCSNC
jgi:hypothetical protein